jgi:hypothetical protein
LNPAWLSRYNARNWTSSLSQEHGSTWERSASLACPALPCRDDRIFHEFTHAGTVGQTSVEHRAGRLRQPGPAQTPPLTFETVSRARHPRWTVASCPRRLAATVPAAVSVTVSVTVASSPVVTTPALGQDDDAPACHGTMASSAHHQGGRGVSGRRLLAVVPRVDGRTGQVDLQSYPRRLAQLHADPMLSTPMASSRMTAGCALSTGTARTPPWPSRVDHAT